MDSADKGFSARFAALTCGWLLLVFSTLAWSTLTWAQSTGATLRGRVLLGEQPAVGAAVVATNAASGFTNRTTTRENGSYVLVGLDPGNYRLKVSGQGYEKTSELIRVQIGQTVNFDVRVPAQAAADAPSAPESTAESTVTTEVGPPTTEVLVVARPLIETRTSEVATNVTTEQIESLPQNNRNFMNFAGLAPGVRVNDKDTQKTFQAGALSANAVNVYIDGASYKNQVLAGGVAGQDSSRGNPFPQNAVREFRVITQNFKAEYEQASSAIITARTKSGTNEFDVDGFAFYQNKSLVARNDFAGPDEPKADFRRLQYGLAFGGPIIQDKMHFFLAYEKNEQDRAERVTLANPAYEPQFGHVEGAFTQPFKEDLFFGKIDFQPTDEQTLEVSYNYRDESDIKDFEGANSYEAANDIQNTVKMARIAHTFDRSSWVNEFSISHMDYVWNPTPLNPDLIGRDYVGVVRLGGSSTSQTVGQKVLTFKDDITFSQLEWMGEHVVKTGVRYSKVDYDVERRQFFNPLFRYLPEISFDFPGEALYGVGDPDLSGGTKQYGLYVQDDWEATQRLTLNLGVRWDYDTDLLNVDYVTPPEVVAAASPFVPARYFSDGNNRKNPKDLIQPRLGFSFDIRDDQKTVLFGGVGRYFDRVLYSELLDERYRLQYQVRRFTFSSDGLPRPNGQATIQWNDAYLSAQGLQNLINSGIAPNPEIFLIEDDTRIPETIQASLGVRHRLGENWLTSLTFARNRSRHGFSYIFGNRNPNGTCCVPVSGGFGPIIISTDDKQTWYTGTFLTLEKLFTQDSRWGMTFAYTYSEAEENGGDLFSFDYPTIADYPRHPTNGDERHRVVFSAIAGLPWEMKISSLITLGSGTGYTIIDQSQGTGPGQTQYRYYTARPERHSFIIPNAWAYRSVDLRLEKAVSFGDQQFSVIAEAFNIFDYENYDPPSYSGVIPAPGQPPNARFGQPSDLLEPGRRLQFGVMYKF